MILDVSQHSICLFGHTISPLLATFLNTSTKRNIYIRVYFLIFYQRWNKYAVLLLYGNSMFYLILNVL